MKSENVGWMLEVWGWRRGRKNKHFSLDLPRLALLLDGLIQPLGFEGYESPTFCSFLIHLGWGKWIEDSACLLPLITQVKLLWILKYPN